MKQYPKKIYQGTPSMSNKKRGNDGHAPFPKERRIHYENCILFIKYQIMPTVSIEN